MRIIYITLLLLSTYVIANAQQLVSSEFLESISKAQLTNDYGIFIQNGVDLYKITYTTNDAHGVLDTASGLLVLPVDSDKPEFHRLCYQHGTVNGPNDVPSNLEGGSALAIIWGGVGLITTAADYIGMGESKGFHPYVHAATEASAAIDLMYASETFLEAEDVDFTNKIFISGYSQGGHAAAAVHRELEANYTDDFQVVASAPMSGPYDISGVMKDGMVSNAVYYTPAYLPNTLLSMNEAYNLGYEVDDLFKQPYANQIQHYYDGTINLFPLNNWLVQNLIINEGSSIPLKMLQDSIVDVALNDDNHPLMLALADNDVYDWTPQAPTRLFYCTADDQVSYLNSIVAEDKMNDNGALDVQAVNVESSADHVDCVEPAITASILFFGPFINAVSTIDKDLEANIEVFPNPATQVVFVQNIPEQSIVELYNIDGQQLWSTRGGTTSLSIPVQQYDKGVYFLVINDGSTMAIKQVVVD